MKYCSKMLAIALACFAMLLPLTTAGCGRPSSSTTAPAADLSVVTSFLPMYIFTANLLEGIEGVSLTNLAAPNVGCLHDYQLLPNDMAILENADIFIYNGAGMEGFLGDLAGRSEHLVMVEAARGISLIDNQDGSPNAHVWLSVPLAIAEVRNISLGLQTADPAHAGQYKANEAAYVARLEKLDGEFRAGLADVVSRRIITFHEAFPYLAAEYGLEVAAVIEREPGSEPSAAELADTIDLIRHEGVQALFAEPQYSTKVAVTIASETGASVRTLDPVVTGEADAGTYEQKMRENLAVLREALDN